MREILVLVALLLKHGVMLPYNNTTHAYHIYLGKIHIERTSSCINRVYRHIVVRRAIDYI